MAKPEKIVKVPTKRPALKHLQCLKCGWKWYPRKVDVRQCPKCRTLYFDIDRGDLDEKIAEEAKRVNRDYFA